MKHSTDIVIHIDETLDDKNRKALATKIQALTGVESASLADNKPHLMIIGYNAKQTKAQDVLKNVRKAGTQAQLVGWL